MSYSNQELASRAVPWEIGITKSHVSSDLQSLGHPGNFPVLLMMVKPILFACFAWETVLALHGRQVNIKHLPLLFSTLLFETGSLTEPGAH